MFLTKSVFVHLALQCYAGSLHCPEWTQITEKTEKFCQITLLLL